MRLLLDTHFLIWLTTTPELVTPTERALMLADDSELAISAASIWEIRIKWSSRYKSGARKIETDPKDALAAASELGARLLPVTAELAAISLTDPIMHRDPFDELLLIQAQQDHWRLLTRDKLLIGHPLALVV